MTVITSPPSAAAERVGALDWHGLHHELDTRGFAVTDQILTEQDCRGLVDLFDGDGFRATIDMARHRFGDGRYRYFEYPLPPVVASVRTAFYPHLAGIANAWAEHLSGGAPRFPDTHEELLERCRGAGQDRPTPLLLRYRPGDWNALHQDLYGEVYFPLQVVTVLSDPERDYGGGEFVLVEQRPRAQSRAHVVRPPQGAFVIFPTRERPNAGTRGYHRVALRHGVSTVVAGERVALGVIFHDAR
jgi:hypothetical protein